MEEPPDLDSLARRYVALWQDQVAAAVVDPELTDALVGALRLLGGSLEASRAMWRAAWPQGEAHDRESHQASGPAPTPGASPDGGLGLDELRSRLAILEDRLRCLEAGIDRAGRRPRKRPRRHPAV